MAAFRKCVPVLAVLAIMLGLMSTAYAQGPAFTCTASAAVPPILRAEGITELTGDIVLNCTGGTVIAAGAAIPQANVTVFLNTAVTSRLLNSSNGSEALLMIDEPTTINTVPASTPGAPFPFLACGSLNGCPITMPGTTGTPGLVYPYTGVNTTAATQPTTTPNVFQGVVSGNNVTFFGVPLAPPGTNGTRVIRITNIRANATPFTSATSSPASAQVIAYVSISGPTSLAINNPQQIVGFVQTGMTFSVRNSSNSGSSSGTTALQCNSLNNGSASSRVITNYVRFSEGFATAFKIRVAGQAVDVGALSPTGNATYTVTGVGSAQGVPGNIYNTESGFVAGGGVLNVAPIGAAFPVAAASGTAASFTSGFLQAGLADFGTRLKVTFNNVQAGVAIYVTRVNTNIATNRVAVMTASETGPYSPVPITNTYTSSTLDVVQVPIVNGTGMAVWEVVASDPFSVQNYDFGVFQSFAANPGSNSPALGTQTIMGDFAPTYATSVTAAYAASSSYPIPRFAPHTTNPNILIITQCRTNLLFPFVTNQAGFDTGLAISNTSVDPFGTTAQAGTCTLNLYGNTGGSTASIPAITTASVAGGSTYVTLASTAFPNFQGYMIAVCNFQFGHGFAFISDMGARNLAMGYLALVIPDPPRSSNPIADLVAGNVSGEMLGQ